VVAAVSRSGEGSNLCDVHPSLAGCGQILIEDLSPAQLAQRCDVVLSCLPHGASAFYVAELLAAGTRVVDLSADYRLSSPELYLQHYGEPHPDAGRLGETPYGLPEMFHADTRQEALVANPGCYPTSALLPLGPLLKNGLIEYQGIVVDSKSGVSGAGRSPKLNSLYCECNESLSAYNVGNHRHQPEIVDLLHRYTGVGSNPDSPEGELRVWPLQLIFHNVGWYLLYEDDQIGQEQGLIRSERLDRLDLHSAHGDLRRSGEQHAAAVARLERLLHLSGGIFFGSDREQQLAVACPSAQRRSQALVTLRFRCAPWAFAFIREGLQRYPIEHTRFSSPLPGDSWWHHPRAPHVLEPGPAESSHPYPVELDLPPWTVAADIDLRNWLFAFAGGIRIESPDDLRQELVERCRQAIEANRSSESPTTGFSQRRRTRPD
jgi:hypothetical protein